MTPEELALRYQRKHRGVPTPQTEQPDQPVPFHAVNEAPGSDGKDGGGKGGDAAHKNANTHLEAVETLALQAKAMREMLGQDGFRAALKTKLGGVRLNQKQQDDVLMQGYGERTGSLEAATADNDAAAAGQSYANLTNASRERANAMSEIAAQGAGESDSLRAQQMSLRNWTQNQNEVARSYGDTLTSINSSLTDLNNDTYSARMSNSAQANADKGTLWNSYYGQLAETQTNLGNTYGQMASELSMANEQVGSKKTRRRRKHLTEASGDAFAAAADATGQAYADPGAKPSLLAWKGRAGFNRTLGPAILAVDSAPVAPEGASLRKWT